VYLRRRFPRAEIFFFEGLCYPTNLNAFPYHIKPALNHSIPFFSYMHSVSNSYSNCENYDVWGPPKAMGRIMNHPKWEVRFIFIIKREILPLLKNKLINRFIEI